MRVRVFALSYICVRSNFLMCSPNEFRMCKKNMSNHWLTCKYTCRQLSGILKCLQLGDCTCKCGHARKTCNQLHHLVELAYKLKNIWKNTREKKNWHSDPGCCQKRQDTGTESQCKNAGSNEGITWDLVNSVACATVQTHRTGERAGNQKGAGSPS